MIQASSIFVFLSHVIFRIQRNVLWMCSLNLLSYQRTFCCHNELYSDTFPLSHYDFICNILRIFHNILYFFYFSSIYIFSSSLYFIVTSFIQCQRVQPVGLISLSRNWAFLHNEIDQM